VNPKSAHSHFHHLGSRSQERSSEATSLRSCRRQREAIRAFRGRDLYFVGKVGTGFSRQTLAALAKAFRPLTRDSPPFVNPPRDKDLTWLEPRLVAQISFKEWTADRKLRQPVFLGLRDDKRPSECLLPKDL